MLAGNVSDVAVQVVPRKYFWLNLSVEYTVFNLVCENTQCLLLILLSYRIRSELIFLMGCLQREKIFLITWTLSKTNSCIDNNNVRVPSPGRGPSGNIFFLLLLMILVETLSCVSFRGRESPSTRELRSWWQISGEWWRLEERETSLTWTGWLCLLTTGSHKLWSILEYYGTLTPWCRPWRKVRQKSVCLP